MSCNPRMVGCRANCAHRDLVRTYQQERERQETAAENDHRNRDGNERAARLITFKQWLIAHRRPIELAA